MQEGPTLMQPPVCPFCSWRSCSAVLARWRMRSCPLVGVEKNDSC